MLYVSESDAMCYTIVRNIIDVVYASGSTKFGALKSSWMFTQISSQKKKTGVIAPKCFVQRVRKQNENFQLHASGNISCLFSFICFFLVMCSFSLVVFLVVVGFRGLRG